MKHFLFTLTLLFAVIFQTDAQRYQRSFFRIRLDDNSPIVVVVDGRHYDRIGNSLTLGGLPPGRHTIKVYSYRGYNNYGGRADLVYRGSVFIDPGIRYEGVVNVRRGTLRVWQSSYYVVDDYGYNNNYHGQNYGGQSPDRSYNDYYDYQDGRINDRYDYNDRNNYGYDDCDRMDYNNNPRDNRDRIRDERNPGRDVPGGRDNGMNPGPGSGNNTIGIGMPQKDMDDLKVTVDKRVADNDKLSLLKNVLAARKYNTEQIRTMMGWLNFEGTRLDLAKWAYDRVSDRQNYWKLETEFSFSSSKTEFSNYIRGRQ